MPPFRKGLRKRKADSEESKENISVKASDESENGSEDEELLTGELDAASDASDSEPEDEARAASDQEQDEVLFDDSADSTFGDDDQADIASEGSSELRDSEDGESVEEDDEDSDKQGETDDDEESVDSGADSGVPHTHSAASDSDTEKPAKETTQKVKKVKQTPAKQSQQKLVKDIKQKTQVPQQGQTKHKTDASIDRLADSIQKASVTIQPVGQKDEYSSGDTSDEEDRRNTVGDVPAWWYDEYAHVGYDTHARRLLRPPRQDLIDDFLKKCEDPDFWRTVRDPSTGQDVVLSKQDLELIQRLRQGHVPDAQHDDHQPWVEWFSRTVLSAPLRAFPEHKRSFLPSRSEQQQVARLVHALKMGWTKTRKQIADERRRKREKNFYNLWGSATSEEEERQRGIHKHIPAPRRALPTHAESYNPPPEYLLDAQELREWEALSETPWRRKLSVLPARHASLRAVPAYPRFTRERFLRCLDLYLAPRALKMRLTIGPDALVPALPSPRELQPFPSGEALCLRGHRGKVRSADFDPSGQYVVSGGDDATVRVWECSTGRCLRSIALEGAVTRVAWAPAPGLALLAAAVGARLVLLSAGAGVGAHRHAARTDRLLEQPPPQRDAADARTAAAACWARVPPEDWARGVRLAVSHFRSVTHVAWHARADYVCVTLADAASRAVVVHQLSRRRSQLPFARSKGLVQCALFHPTRPLLFVATQRVVRVYDLVKQELVRKLLTGAQWISHMAVHPGGDNLLVASYDRKCIWFDLELSSKPYQSLRLHGGAVRSVAFHRRYPLFASAGDDERIVVSHGMVYNDLLQNPLLVPLKQLRAGARADQLCVLELRWHPTQPWLLAACADSTLRLYT